MKIIHFQISLSALIPALAVVATSAWAQGNAPSDDAEKQLRAVRGLDTGYSKGQANVQSPGLDREREKLSGQGYAAVYSLAHVAPGTGAEYWSNAQSKKCAVLYYKTNDNAWVRTGNVRPRKCVDPAVGKSK